MSILLALFIPSLLVNPPSLLPTLSFPSLLTTTAGPHLFVCSDFSCCCCYCCSFFTVFLVFFFFFFFFFFFSSGVAFILPALCLLYFITHSAMP